MKPKLWSMTTYVMAAAVLLSGCGAGQSLNRAEPLPEPASNPAKLPAGVTLASLNEPHAADAGTIALQWNQVPDPPPLHKLSDWPQSVDRTIRDIGLYGFDGIKITVYAKKGDTDFLHAALTAKDGVYDLGEVAGYVYDKPEDVSVKDVVIFQRQLIQLTGTVGASATQTRYIAIEDGVPKPALLIDTGRVRHLDLDGDGKEEIVATSGTPMKTYVYRWNEGHTEMCDLNEALGAASVSISPERAVEAWDGQSEQIHLYWMTPRGLRPISQYTREEYDSDRFVKIPYTDPELREIERLADRIGVMNPLIAGKGVATDYGVQPSIVEDDVLQLSYPHFSVRQSTHDLKPQGGTTVRELKLDGNPICWIETDGGSGAWYWQRNGTYLSVGSAKPVSEDQLLYVAASLAPLEGRLTQPEKPLSVTRDYLLALNAMNEFVTAWLHRDASNGVKWVSDEVKRRTDPDVLSAYFTGVSNPHHQAFEVTGKKQISDERFAFHVLLYEYYTAQPDAVNGLPYEHAAGVTIEVVKQGEDEWGQPVWRVNGLP